MRWLIVLLLGLVLAINALPSDVEDFDAGDENDGASLHEDEGTDDENEADEAEAEDPAELENVDDAGSDEIEGENDPRRRCPFKLHYVCRTTRKCSRVHWLHWRRKCTKVRKCRCTKCFKVRRLYRKCGGWKCRFYYKNECSYVKCIRLRTKVAKCHGKWLGRRCSYSWRYYCRG